MRLIQRIYTNKFLNKLLHLGLLQKAEQRWSRFTAVAVQAVGGKGVRALLKTINPEDLSPRFRNCAACAHQLFIGPNTAGFYASWTRTGWWGSPGKQEQLGSASAPREAGRGRAAPPTLQSSAAFLMLGSRPWGSYRPPNFGKAENVFKEGMCITGSPLAGVCPESRDRSRQEEGRSLLPPAPQHEVEKRAS